MPPSTPEQRFEVPPEYAEVYERAYRRAYEEGLGQLSSGEDAQPLRGSSLSRPRGRRGSRGSRAAPTAPWSSPGTSSGPTSGPGTRTVRTRRPSASRGRTVVGHPDEPRRHPRPTGPPVERRRRRSSIAWALGMVVLALVLVPGSFVLGRSSVGRVDVPDVTAGVPPGGRATAGAAPAVYAGAVETGLAGLQAALEPPGPYRGAVSRLVGARADATCAAPADRDARGRRVSYSPGNVLDGLLATGGCARARAWGQRLSLSLDDDSATVVRVGPSCPDTAKDRPLPADNRIPGWPGCSRRHPCGAVPSATPGRTRSLRTLRIERVRTRTVVLQNPGAGEGIQETTPAISAVTAGHLTTR
jgi:hypothetical protein